MKVVENVISVTVYRKKRGAVTYRFGFNGKENDNEVKGGDGLQQDYGMRVYDNRLGKFLSVDPLEQSYPWYTPYQFAGNKPIWAIDLDGLEEWKVNEGEAVYGPFANQDEANKAAKNNPSLAQKRIEVLPTITIVRNSVTSLQKKYPEALPLAMSGIYSTALSLYTGRYNTYGSVSSQVMNDLTEEQKQLDFISNAPKATAILLWEFLNGTGPKSRSFNESHPITDEIKYSESTERAVWSLIQAYQNGSYREGESHYFYAATSPDKESKLASLKSHLKAYASTPATFLRGGMEYFLTKKGNSVMIKVVDNYTVASMLTRNDQDNILRHSRKATPLGNTDVTFEFTVENIDFNLKKE